MAAYRPPHEPPPSCPFCSYAAASHSDRDVYMLLQHVELTHNDGDSPFLARDASPEARTRSTSRPRSSSRASSRSSRGRHSRSHSRNSSLTPTLHEDVYVECPLRCGEAIHIRELDDHMDLHEIENSELEELDGAPSSSRHHSPRPPTRSRSLDHEHRSRHSLHAHRAGDYLAVPEDASPRKQRNSAVPVKDLFVGPAPKKTRPADLGSKSGSIKRLGKSELGPHAFEERMPSWLYKQLEHGAPTRVVNTIGRNGAIVQVEKVENESAGVIPVLAQLCGQDRAVSKVFLCHPAVRHVFKTPKEGGFCGYRNIQMMVSFMQGTGFPGHQHFPGRTPSIIRLQDMIESAWDHGFNSSGRIETGGICGTRKYIGTPEAQALLLSLDIPVEANAFNRSKSKSGGEVYTRVIQAALEYFSTGVTDPSAKVYQTGLAPIYFQHPGHSLTIVGLEIRKSGRMNLLVFDPMFKTNPGISRLIGTKFNAAYPEKLLKAYRRGEDYLGKYHSFEILKLMAAPSRELTPPPPLSGPPAPQHLHRSGTS